MQPILNPDLVASGSIISCSLLKTVIPRAATKDVSDLNESSFAARGTCFYAASNSRSPAPHPNFTIKDRIVAARGMTVLKSGTIFPRQNEARDALS